MRRHRLTAFVFLALLVFKSVSECRDQNWPLSGRNRSPVRTGIYTGIPIPGEKTPVMIDLDVDRSFVVLTRPQGEEGGNRFVGGVEISIEIVDSLRNSVARFLKQRDVAVLESDAAGEKDGISQKISFLLPPGNFWIVVEVTDLSSQRRYYDDSRRLRIPAQDSGSVMLSDILFGVVEDSGSSIPSGFRPFALGGDVPFGSTVSVALEARVRSGGSTEPVRITLSRTGADNPVTGRRIIDSLFTDPMMRGKQLSDSGNEDRLEYFVTTSPDTSRQLLFYTFPPGVLTPGGYHLSIFAGDSGKGERTDKAFSVRWIGAPVSLSNPDVAIAAMEYVMTSGEYQALASAPGDSLYDRFMKFWSTRDPIPETAMNEALLEYYRRVDSTREKFAGMKVPDGMKTERGKAFILYGPPASVRRVLTPGEAPVESWDYPGLGKRLVFEDRGRQGEYLLIRIDSLSTGKQRP